VAYKLLQFKPNTSTYYLYIIYIMHFSVAAFAALLSATIVVAAPAASPEPINIGQKLAEKKQYIKDCKKDFEYKWSHDDWKKSEKLFYFDAEYVVKATPDQVIATDQTPAPGQPGAKGIFKYGINIAENTICYVRISPVHLEVTHLTLLRTSPSAA
jgi:hypothetical protein